MKSYSSKEVIKVLLDDGWFEIACIDNHHQFKHIIKSGKVTVKHPQKDIPITTLKRIEKQTSIKFL